MYDPIILDSVRCIHMHSIWSCRLEMALLLFCCYPSINAVSVQLTAVLSIHIANVLTSNMTTLALLFSISACIPW